ncbi:GTP cyclohydrolase I FolE [Bacillus subtilis]|uniref:GTP cyclohydrolase I FolE n=1 Tax=Bacillus TaxID=1386 RepID=UPI0002597C60|nr:MULTISPECIES: GTP cyclohydrolase I FolE [Bacillus]QQF64481.1 GTP cyclohydrolase I FolE [Bacillus mojavensis]AFI27214.1 GTP cyclohydrolase I [Bacillus sp. JS]MBO3637051.1 GTP cyclohydrolase I FolE [Bacillus subtilis]MCV2517494.1 GTP cyclohydrolase I FolE [Bacillus subtilis]QHJ99347.1 GTP cyclohydrolase 1 [Bacillus subtilis]
MEHLFKGLIEGIGEDFTREGLIKTPARATKALYFLTSGYKENLDEIFNGAIFNENSNDMVIIKNIEFYSLCEHHMLPFWGTCHVGYIPNGKIVGLSKVARLVNHFSRRLQVQERLTKQIAVTLKEYLDAEGVAVIIQAKHLCMMMRGIEKQQSETLTKSMVGCFLESDRKNNEFMRLLGLE